LRYQNRFLIKGTGAMYRKTLFYWNNAGQKIDSESDLMYPEVQIPVYIRARPDDDDAGNRNIVRPHSMKITMDHSFEGSLRSGDAMQAG
jgi:hypothetical protein